MGFGLGFDNSSTPPPEPEPRTTRRRRSSRRRRRSGSRSNYRTRSSRSGSRTSSRRARDTINTLLILKLCWWLVHGIIAVMVVHMETTRAHNFVAAMLIMPEFSLERISIGYIFKDRDKRHSWSTVIFFGYAIQVAFFMFLVGGAMKGLLLLTAAHDIDDLVVIAGLSTVIPTFVLGPVEMIRVVSDNVLWVLLFGLAAYYVHLELVFIPALYALILAVTFVDYLIYEPMSI